MKLWYFVLKGPKSYEMPVAGYSLGLFQWMICFDEARLGDFCRVAAQHLKTYRDTFPMTTWSMEMHMVEGEDRVVDALEPGAKEEDEP